MKNHKNSSNPMRISIPSNATQTLKDQSKLLIGSCLYYCYSIQNILRLAPSEYVEDFSSLILSIIQVFKQFEKNPPFDVSSTSSSPSLISSNSSPSSLTTSSSPSTTMPSPTSSSISSTLLASLANFASIETSSKNSSPTSPTKNKGAGKVLRPHSKSSTSPSFGISPSPSSPSTSISSSSPPILTVSRSSSSTSTSSLSSTNSSTSLSPRSVVPSIHTTPAPPTDYKSEYQYQTNVINNDVDSTLFVRLLENFSTLLLNYLNFWITVQKNEEKEYMKKINSPSSLASTQTQSGGSSSNLFSAKGSSSKTKNRPPLTLPTHHHSHSMGSISESDHTEKEFLSSPSSSAATLQTSQFSGDSQIIINTLKEIVSNHRKRRALEKMHWKMVLEFRCFVQEVGTGVLVKKSRISRLPKLVDVLKSQFWKKYFSQQTEMVEWNAFVRSISEYLSVQMTLSQETTLNQILDNYNTGYVAASKFGDFLKAFGPIEKCLENMERITSQPWFHGFLSVDEARRLLIAEPVGTFLVRFSKSRSDSFALEFVDEPKHVRTVLISSNMPEGVRVQEESKKYHTFPDLFELLSHYCEILVRSYKSDFITQQWFFGELTREETEEYFFRWPPGTFLVRFSEMKKTPFLFVCSFIKQDGSYQHIELQKVPDGYVLKHESSTLSNKSHLEEDPNNLSGNFNHNSSSGLQESSGERTLYSSIQDFIKLHQFKLKYSFDLQGIPVLQLDKFQPMKQNVRGSLVANNLQTGTIATYTNLVCSQSIVTYPKGSMGYNTMCDHWAVELLGDRILAVVADGCGWGKKSQAAAIRATSSFISFLSNPKVQEDLTDTQRLRHQLFLAFHKAHENIISGGTNLDSGTTTLCGGMAVRIKRERETELAFVCASVGDCKCFQWKNSLQRVVDITATNRGTNDARDPGGRLGPYLDGGQPDLRNLDCYFAPCEEDDIVMIVSDGVHDNFDPESLGKKPTDIGLNYEKWSEMDPMEAEKLKNIFRIQLLTEMLNSCPEKTPEMFTSTILSHSYSITRPKREYMEVSSNRTEPRSSVEYPGKMDHATCLAFRVSSVMSKYGGDAPFIRDSDYEALTNLDHYVYQPQNSNFNLQHYSHLNNFSFMGPINPCETGPQFSDSSHVKRSSAPLIGDEEYEPNTSNRKLSPLSKSQGDSYESRQSFTGLGTGSLSLSNSYGLGASIGKESFAHLPEPFKSIWDQFISQIEPIHVSSHSSTSIRKVSGPRGAKWGYSELNYGDPPDPSLDEWAFLDTISTFPPIGTYVTEERCLSKYPACTDSYLLELSSTRITLTFAAGYEWGARSREASVRASTALMEYLDKNQELIRDFRSAVGHLISGFSSAHKAIIRDKEDIFGASTTSLVGGLLLKLDSNPNFTSLQGIRYSTEDVSNANANNQPTGTTSTFGIKDEWAFVCLSIGNCKAYHYSQKSSLVTSLIINNTEHCEPGDGQCGRLGPGLENGGPDIHDIQFSIQQCEEDDMILIVSDGISDNFDPEYLGFRPEQLSLNITSWPEIPTKETLEAKEKYALRFISSLFSPQISPSNVCQKLTDYCINTTLKLHDFVINNPKKRVPKDHTKFPGRLDHCSCVCFRVGTFRQKTLPTDLLLGESLYMPMKAPPKK